ncbi:MAG: hypothetical protein Q4C95_03875 [Planctomycetia bacterium]|nr:hypothetical protein [Planctomycetia bacterium]
MIVNRFNPVEISDSFFQNPDKDWRIAEGKAIKMFRANSHQYLNIAVIIILSIGFFMNLPGFAKGFDWQCVSDAETGQYSIQIFEQGQLVLESPSEGLWSIATDWQNEEPAAWKHIPAMTMEQLPDSKRVNATDPSVSQKWIVLSGELAVSDGTIFCRDCWTEENGRLKCIRRFEYQGEKPLSKITLSVRMNAFGSKMQAFLPGILYYGNPSGEKNTPQSVPVYHAEPGEFAIFEEHRYPMPFACLEDAELLNGLAIYPIPSPVARGSVPDQFWSMGVRALENQKSEFVLYSGFVGYNRQNSIAKAIQAVPMNYPETTMTLLPNAIVEKTFYLDAWKIERPGTAFQHPIQKTLEFFAPFYADDLPSDDFILRNKLEFAISRWMDKEGGFNMFPSNYAPKIIMGWCGQADSCGYALQVLEPKLLQLCETPEQKSQLQNWIHSAVQRSLDLLSTSPVDETGFSIQYDPAEGIWKDSKDHVSMGQAMYNFAKAIQTARKKAQNNSKENGYDFSNWENFLKKAAESTADRILQEDWNPLSTAEGFYIAPMIIASELFENEQFKDAAVKAADHFAERHLSMKEPYWGGTLDAQCEDKEGAWAAFQGFLTMYEITQEAKYLIWAKHACDVCLSYLVVWDIPLPPGRLADHRFRTRGWTVVSPQNQHLDVYGVLFAPEVYRIGELLNIESYKKVSEVMFRSCGQLIDPWGSQGEQIQQTNFAQRGDMSDVLKLRGGYAEAWTVFWITTHFLNSAARMEELKTVQ